MTQITEAIDVAPRPETPPSTTAQEAEIRYYTASQFQLMWWKFKKHRLALVGSTVLGIFFFIAGVASGARLALLDLKNPEIANFHPSMLFDGFLE